LHFEGARLYSI
jgi:hypothetical protein